MIVFDEAKRIFWLETQNTVYAMQITQENMLCHLYWGRTPGSVEDLPTVEEFNARYHAGPDGRWFQEYPGWGHRFFNMHALKATFEDGTRNLYLRYESHRINGEELIITLQDELGLLVEVKYVLRPELDIIDHSARIVNKGSMTVTL